MSAEQTNAGSANDAMALALSALVWILQDEERADRLLALTGLDADGIRARIADPTLMEAVLGYLEGHEPDLIACAKTLDVPPVALVLARERLSL
ncbi:MAG: hypothetical protein JWO15_3310 [Sphingomonadales bacterium]|nr:hypothetical protein [Sphingomonadales bacterium]